MYTKLKAEPVDLYLNDKIFMVPREKIAAAYAGAMAAKECLINELSSFCFPGCTFLYQYKKSYPACITAANNIGLSATVETFDYWNPGKGLNNFLKDRLEHKDTSYYPFFEED